MDFEFLVIDDHAVVKRYNGENTEVIIPKQYKGFPVTKIADYCFANSKITTIVGESIKSIDSRAFIYCSHLTNVNFPVCSYIGGDAFYDCSSLTNVNLPACEDVSSYVFGYCSSLTNVNLPVCKSVGTAVFCNCLSLISIEFPVCKYVGSSAFIGCTSLTSVNLPVCTSIYDKAFAFCTSLTEINLPNCSYIDSGTFYDCTNLTEINLPVCKYIGEYAFDDCKKLIKRGKYKATKIDLTCRGFQYELGKWFEEDEAIICKKGFHYVENFYDILNYYHGKLGEDLRIFEVEAEEIYDEHKDDSKRVCKKIKLVKEIKSYQEIFKK